MLILSKNDLAYTKTRSRFCCKKRRQDGTKAVTGRDRHLQTSTTNNCVSSAPAAQVIRVRNQCVQEWAAWSLRSGPYSQFCQGSPPHTRIRTARYAGLWGLDNPASFFLASFPATTDESDLTMREVVQDLYNYIHMAYVGGFTASVDGGYVTKPCPFPFSISLLLTSNLIIVLLFIVWYRLSFLTISRPAGERNLKEIRKTCTSSRRAGAPTLTTFHTPRSMSIWRSISIVLIKDHLFHRRHQQHATRALTCSGLAALPHFLYSVSSYSSASRRRLSSGARWLHIPIFLSLISLARSPTMTSQTRAEVLMSLLASNSALAAPSHPRWITTWRFL